jgi:Predicted membrane protein, hemolysin III homolog
MSINKIKLPEYSVKQDVWNSITHGIGVLFAIVVTVLMLLKVTFWGYSGANHIEQVYRIVGICLYGAGMLLCYTISTVYHGLFMNNGKKVLRVIDHDTVYCLIAGTYSIYCLVTLRNVTMWGSIPYIGWIIFGICWLGVIVGIVFNSIDMNKFKILSFSLYIIIGWTIILASKELITSLTLSGYLFLLGGGLAYTIGSVLYGIGAKKSLWWHVVFHCFILLGTILQFISIWCYVLN